MIKILGEPSRKPFSLAKKIIGMCTSVLQNCRYLVEEVIQTYIFSSTSQKPSLNTFYFVGSMA